MVRLRGEVRRTLRLAAPVVLTNLGVMGMGFVDILVVGRLGVVALAAVSIANAIFFTISVLVMGVLLALEPMVAQAEGAGQRSRRGELLWAAAWLGGVLSLPLTAVFLDATWLVALTGVGPEVAFEAGRYLSARSLALTPFLLWTCLRCVFTGVGNPTPVLVVTLVANVVNAVADVVLVYGALGAPELGVAGAGIATACSRWFMVVTLVVWALYRSPLAEALRPRRPNLRLIGRLVKAGLPIGFQLLAEVGFFSAGTVIVASFGPLSQAGHQIAGNLAGLAFMVPLGLAAAASVRVGNAVGGGRIQAARRAGWVALGLGAVASLGAGAVLLAVPGWLAGLFSSEPAVVAAAVPLVRLAGAFALFDGAQVIAGGCLRGAGDTRTPLLVHLVALWVVGLPVGYGLAVGLGQGATGLWFGFTAALAAAAAGLVWCVLRRAPQGRLLID